MFLSFLTWNLFSSTGATPVLSCILRKLYCKTSDGPAFPTARWEEFCQKVRSVSRKIRHWMSSQPAWSVHAVTVMTWRRDAEFPHFPVLTISCSSCTYTSALRLLAEVDTLCSAFLLVKTRSGEENGRRRISKMRVFGSYRMLLLLGGFASAQPKAQRQACDW